MAVMADRIIKLLGTFSLCVLVGLTGIFSADVASGADSSDPAQCLQIPRQAPGAGGIAAVTFCETAANYSFQITGTTHDYAKSSFQMQLTTALKQWFTSNGQPAPDHGTVDFWLAVPEDSPEATQARAVLTWDGGSLIAYLAIEPESWSITNQMVSILAAGQTYPKNYGYSVGSLLIEAASGVSVSDVGTYLSTFGATDAAVIDGAWSSYHVAPLSELSIEAAIAADPLHAHWVKQTEANSVFEWIAIRQRAFAFSFANP